MINLISPINQLGYGITGLNITKALSKITDVALWVIGQPQLTNQEDADTISQCLKNAQLPDFTSPCIRIWHQHDMSQFVGRGQHIGFPIFELDKFSNIEKHHLSSLDKIFVCSSWAKNVILNNINIAESNVVVVPLGVDSDIFKPVESQHKNTIFFNCGKFEIRKGHDILVDIFNKAFNTNDSVELWLMCDNPFLNENETKEWHQKYYKSKLGSKIKIIPRLNTQQEVYNIMSQIDCGVFPSRAEGWNLELLECMACGKNVITTNYSAHTEFCNKDNSYLIDISDTELAFDNKWFFKQGNWAKIDSTHTDQFVENMRNIHANKQNSSLLPNNAGIATAKKFSWKNTAEIMLHNV